MEVLNIEGTGETPSVIFDKANGIFEISGRSLPEDSAEFYGPITAWIQQYIKNPNPVTEFAVKLEYYNTASSKLLQDLLTLFEGVAGAKIVWYFLEDDEDMEEAGQEFEEIIGVPFEFRPI